MTTTRNSIVEQPGERGSALVGVLLLLMMMSALAAALGVNGQTETLISRNQRSGAQAQAAAEAGLNHGVELATRYIFEWKANGKPDVDAAIAALLAGPDGDPDTVEDNQSLGARAGIDADEDIPLDTDGSQRLDLGVNATYTAIILDDAGAAVGEPTNDPTGIYDENHTLVVRATGYGPDNTKVVLEALISPLPLPALVTGGDLVMSGNVTINGTQGDVHSNGSLIISGNSADVSGDASASGTLTCNSPCPQVEGTASGGAAQLPLPAVRASDYRSYADYILTSAGLVTLLDGTLVIDCSGTGNPCGNSRGLTFNSGSVTWSFVNDEVLGTYYVEGSADIAGAGSGSTPAQVSIIAEGSIDVGGNTYLTPDSPELLFVTDVDLDISGGGATGVVQAQGQILVHEQLDISGSPDITGQIIVENAANTPGSPVTSNSISGNPIITYNGGLGSGVYSVTGWRDVRE